jgi:DNA mismatch repair protein MutL
MTDETTITRLDPETVARIAAGEVVERPASVVKELVENSLDADAGRIDVTVEEGGIDRIRVRDDGIGMSRADVETAIEEHTTSKISDASELEGVTTLGFRGEALHTIGAISRMTITTTSRGGDGTGTRLRYVGGDVETVEPAGHPEGTTVEVEELFYNTPARRKYLSEVQTEFRHVSKVLGRYALANPDVAVSLTHDDREVFATTGDGDIQSAVMAVYGRDVAEAMMPVEVEYGDGEGPLDRITGYVSHPETTRSRAEYVAGYVNGRYVETEAVRNAVVSAYGGQLAADRYPFAVLFLELPAERVDVNVHPRKLAVRFEDAAGVQSAVETAVRDSLLSEGLLRSSAPRGRSAPAETSVQSEVDHAESTAASTGDRSERTGSDAGSETAESHSAVDTADEASRPTAEQSDRQEPQDDQEPAGTATAGTDSDGEVSEPVEQRARTPGESETTTRDEESTADESTLVESGRETSARRASAGEHRKFDATDQQTLDGTGVSRTDSYDRLPPLCVLGQAHETFLVAESPDGLVLVDQHAADERIHYERLRDALDADATAQTLASPVEFSLTPDEAAVVDEYGEALARLGFHVDREDTRLRVRTVPTVLGEQLPPERVRDVFGTLLDADESAANETVTELASELLADLACAPAVTGNTSLTEGSVQELLAALDDCDNPYACPHGRPTIVELETSELEERFERDYPGHGTRR